MALNRPMRRRNPFVMDEEAERRDERARLARILLDPDTTISSGNGAMREARRKLHPDPPERTRLLPKLDWREPFNPAFEFDWINDNDWFKPRFEPDRKPPTVDPDAPVGGVPKERDGESELRKQLRRAYIEDLRKRGQDR